MSPEQDPSSQTTYRPRLGPWAAGLAVGAMMAAVLAFFFPTLAIGMIIVGLATGVGMAIALQAGADDIARRTKDDEADAGTTGPQ